MGDDDVKRFSDHKLQEFYDEFENVRDQVKANNTRVLNALEANTAAIKAQAKATEDLVAAWDKAQGFVWVINKISRAAARLIPLGIAVGAIWYFLKTGHWPKGQ